MPQNLQGVKRLLAPCLLSSLHSGWRTLSSTPSPIMSLFLPETKNCVEKASLAHCFSNCDEPFKETGADEHSSFLPSLLSLVEVPVHLLARLGDLFSLCLFIYFNWRRLESPLDCREIKPVHPKGNQHSIFIGRTDAKAETPILWPPDEKSQLIGKDPDAGKNRRQEEKGMTEDEMVGWHHRLDGHEFEPALGDGKRQGSLACCSPWGHKQSNTTEQLTNKCCFVALQCCTGFCCTTKWIGHTHTCIPSLLGLPPTPLGRHRVLN